MPAMIQNLFVNAVRLAVLAAFTFAFIVLFEHGPRGFVEGVFAEWHLLTTGKSDAAPSRAKSPDSGT